MPYPDLPEPKIAREMLLIEYARPVVVMVLIVIGAFFYFGLRIQEWWLFVAVTAMAIVALACFIFYFWANWKARRRRSI